MSYDIQLVDRDTFKTIQLPIKHVMIGGTYAADYDKVTGTFTPKPISEAHLNITYNYSRYYYEATEDDPRFTTVDDDKVIMVRCGIRAIYGKTGGESIEMLEDMIRRIKDKYYKNGDWITTEREVTKFISNNSGKELDFWDIIEDKYLEGTYHKENSIEYVYEGDDSDYWRATAINALRPLYQLLEMAKLRPDGIWDGD